MSKGIHKKIIGVLAATGFCTSAFAVAPGLYLGLMMGPTNANPSEQQLQILPLPTATSTQANTGPGNANSSVFGSRAYIGYKFNQYAGFEGGFDYFSGITYRLKNEAQVPAAGTTARVRGIDIVGKLDYSYNNTIGVFGKLGVAALYTTTPGSLNVTNYHVVNVRVPNPAYQDQISTPGVPKYTTSPQAFNVGSSTYTSKLTPTFTLGASYDFNQNWVAEASWMVLAPGGYIGNINFYSLGLSYHFVDKYCGEFLC